jgi:ribonuclease T1
LRSLRALGSVLAAVAIAVLLSLAGGCSSAPTSGDAATVSPSGEPTTVSPPVSSSPSTGASAPSVTSVAAPVASGVDPVSGLPWIGQDQLPVEAEQALLVIESGGPYPYDQDGVTFENREGILPARPLGYYREFTVETPGSDDRGARRIVVADSGEWFYTDDHYDSFSRIVR